MDNQLFDRVTSLSDLNNYLENVTIDQYLSEIGLEKLVKLCDSLAHSQFMQGTENDVSLFKTLSCLLVIAGIKYKILSDVNDIRQLFDDGEQRRYVNAVKRCFLYAGFHETLRPELEALKKWVPRVESINPHENRMETYSPSHEGHVYIGRRMPGLLQSKWANKYVISRKLERITCLLKYAQDFWDEDVSPLFGKTLYCWCVSDTCQTVYNMTLSQMTCHGQVLAWFCVRDILFKKNTNDRL